LLGRSPSMTVPTLYEGGHFQGRGRRGTEVSVEMAESEKARSCMLKAIKADKRIWTRTIWKRRSRDQGRVSSKGRKKGTQGYLLTGSAATKKLGPLPLLRETRKEGPQVLKNAKRQERKTQEEQRLIEKDSGVDLHKMTRTLGDLLSMSHGLVNEGKKTWTGPRNLKLPEGSKEKSASSGNGAGEIKKNSINGRERLLTMRMAIQRKSKSPENSTGAG